MEILIYYLFIILFISWFLVGVVQILIGLGTVISTNNSTVRKHMAYYLAGVSGYFLVLWAATEADHSGEYTGFTIIWFLTGSISLFLYQMVILTRREFLS